MSKKNIVTETPNVQGQSITEEQRAEEKQTKKDTDKFKENDKSKEKNKNRQNNDSGGKPSKYKSGDVLKFVRVRFPGNAKSFPFIVEKRNFRYGQKVVAMSDRGMTVGYINSFPHNVNFNKSMLPIRNISREASQEDIEEQRSNIMKEKEAEVLCLNLIKKYELDMTLTHVEFLHFGKKAVFYFNAPNRVDFRNLVKDLVKDLKMRIELRQISVRDRAAALGAIGPCGLQTCCSSFLKSYGNVSIKLAKNQNLALIASKVNGVCGQIKCCVKYEDEVYTEKKTRLPREGEMVNLKNGDKGKVTKVHILSEKFEIMTDKGQIRRYECGLYDSKNKLPDNWAFPSSFDHIVNETANLIKLEKSEDAHEKTSEGHAKDSGKEESKSTLAKPLSNTRKEESKKPEDQNRRPPSRRDPRDNKKPAEREARDGKKSQSQRRRRFRKGRGPNPAQKAQQKKKEP